MRQDKDSPIDLSAKSTNPVPMSHFHQTSTRMPIDDDSVPSDADLQQWDDLERLVRLALQSSVNTMPESDGDRDIPRQVGRFKIIAPLGSGGGGVVYQGLDPILNRVVAIKVLHSHLITSGDFQQRFLQEGQILSELTHSNIVVLYEVGYNREQPFLVFEYCAGGALSSWLENQSQPLTFETCARIVLPLARALQYAHDRGILHRDVNPKNVLLVPISQPEPPDSEFPFTAKLSDFGLGTWQDEQRTAVRTHTGAVMGTLYYMAPEQSRAATCTALPTIDLYALGVILYELLTRHRPFAGETPVETLRQIQELDPIPPRKLRTNLPRDLETICLKCLEKSPVRRFQNAADLVGDLERFLAGSPILSRRVSLAETTVRWIAKRRFQVGVTALLILLVVTLGLGAVILHHEMGKSVAVVRASEKATQELNSRLLEIEDRKRTIEQQRITDARALQEKQRRLEYDLQIATIARTGDIRSFSTIQKLRQLRPKSHDETDLRGFEWYYLMHRYGGDCVTLNRYDASTQPIEAMHVSDTGESVYLAQRLQLTEWRIRPEQRYRVIHQAQHTIRDFAISQQRNRLAVSVCESPEIRLFDLTSLQQIPLSPAPSSDVRWCNSLAFHPTTGDLYSISSATSEFHHPCRIDKSGVDSKRELLDTIAHNRRIFDVAFDGSTNQLIHSTDNLVQVTTAGGDPAQTLEVTASQQHFVTSLALSDNCQTLAASTDQGDIYLFQKTESNQWQSDGKLPVTNRRSPPLPAHHSINRMPVRFNQKGDRLYAPGENDLHLWNLRQRQEEAWITELPGGAVRYLELLDQGQTVAWTTEFHLGLWKPIADLPGIEGHTKEAWTVAFSPIDQIIATSSDDHSVRIWSLSTGQMLKELSGHQATVNRVAFSDQGDKLASISLDGTIRIWDSQTWNLMHVLQGGNVTIRSLAWFADGQRIAITNSPTESDRPHQVQIWDIRQNRPLNTLGNSDRRLHSLQITADQNEMLVASDDGSISLWNVKDATVRKRWDEDEKPNCSLLMNHDRWLACGIGQGLIRIRNLKTGAMIRDFVGHSHPILSLAVSPDGRILASGGLDNTVRLWDVETGHCMLIFDEQQAQINSVAFSPDGSILASAAHDGSIKLRYGPRFNALPEKWTD